MSSKCDKKGNCKKGFDKAKKDNTAPKPANDQCPAPAKPKDGGACCPSKKDKCCP